MLKTEQIQDLELDLLIKAIKDVYGHDFSGYSRESFSRRVQKGLKELQLDHISEIIPLVLHDSCLYDRFFLNLSVNVTEMFRNPSFFLFLREQILPLFKDYAVIKFWLAGCSTGEEVYSLAILLKEENLYDRALIYATDFNEEVLRKAQDGIYALGPVREYQRNYRAAGGKASFADYCTSDEKSIIFDRSLKRNIIFSLHDLTEGREFSKVDILICRNVMIYFDKPLKEKVFNLFAGSLLENGFLCLGISESLRHSTAYTEFETFSEPFKIYRKKVEKHSSVNPLLNQNTTHSQLLTDSSYQLLMDDDEFN